MLRYDAMCPECGAVEEYAATYETIDSAAPKCGPCQVQMEQTWITAPYTTPERMWAEGSVATRGKRVKINDCDDPWSDTPGLCAEQSEEFMAKRQETLHGKVSNWGDRKGSIHFDVGAE